MAQPNSDLQSKINRAVRAVLLDQGAVQRDNCYAAPASDDRTLPNTTITTGDGIPFDGPGNWQFPEIMVNLRDPATVQPDEADPENKRISANERCSNIYNALNRSDDTTTFFFTAAELTRLGRLLAVDQSNGTDPVQVQSALNNADMADFTVLFWEPGLIGSPSKNQDGTFWSRELAFSCVACNAALAA